MVPRINRIAVQADLRDGMLKIRLYGPDFYKGYQSVSGASLNNPAGMVAIRKDGAAMAQKAGVPFDDVTLH